MGEFITVSLYSQSRSVFQGEISCSDFPRCEKYRLLYCGRAGLGTAWIGILGSLGDCKVAVEIDWEGFPFCSLNIEGREAEDIGIAGNSVAPDPPLSTVSCPGK